MSGGDLFLGLISGTSTDAIDVVLADFEPAARVLATHTHPWPAELRARIVALARNNARVSLDELGQLDGLIANEFAAAANALLDQAAVDRSQVRALGSHGQTVCHRPEADPSFTMQLGDPSRIAERTGIDVVADFRHADMAAGGQGAPLLPVLHKALFSHDDEARVILNLGGIANISVLAPSQPVLGFDTGPANCLMDAWAERHLGHAPDRDGEWARSGTVAEGLLSRCLSDPYFRLSAPKSTGREYFNLDWLDERLIESQDPADVQATLLALTVQTITDAIHACAPGTQTVIACGGGVYNGALMAALTTALPPARVQSTADYDVDPDFVEATAFAWLARQRLLGLPGNLPSVTGARGPRVLGVIAAAPRDSRKL